MIKKFPITTFRCHHIKFVQVLLSLDINEDQFINQLLVIFVNLSRFAKTIDLNAPVLVY